jgi:GNAT superfamily N-acetyltransferase
LQFDLFLPQENKHDRAPLSQFLLEHFLDAFPLTKMMPEGSFPEEITKPFTWLYVDYAATILARKNNQIVGARVGSIERFPWMSTPLPTHMPEPTEIIKAFIEELTKKENYRKVGIKTGTKVYVAKVLATRNDMRGTGIASRLMDEAIKMAKEQKCKFFEVVSTNCFVHQICLKRGFEAVHEIKYDDYRYNGACPFTRIDPKHETAIHFIKKLD